MSPTLRAMVWELLRTSRTDLLGRIGYAVLIVLALNSISQLAQEDLTSTTRGLLIIIAIAASVFSLSWIRELDRGQTGFSFRMNFVRPISTLQLVGVPMAFSVLTSAICFLAPTQLHRLVSGAPMPVLGPLAFVTCVVVCLTGAAWATKTIADTLIALGVLFLGLLCFLVFYHQQQQATEPFVLAVGTLDYFQFGLTHYAILFVVSGVALCLTVVAVDRQRHGDGWSIVEPIQGLLRSRARQDSPGVGYRGPVHAQFAYEFRRTAPAVLTLGLIGPLGVYAFIRFGHWMNPKLTSPDTIWQGAPVMWMLALGIGPFLYQLLGANSVIGLRKRGEVYRLSAFDAAIPMTNDQLIAIKLVVVALCALVAWACTWVAAFLYLRFGVNGELWPKVLAELNSVGAGGPRGLWLFGGLASALLFYVGSTSVLLGFGLTVPFYPRVFTGLMCFGYANFGLAFMDFRNGWEYGPAWRVYGYVVAAVIGLVCAFAIWLAVRQRAMSARSMCVVGTLWAVFVGMVCVIAQRVPSIGTPLQLVVGALLLVPLAATVCGPLALGLQRHRP